MNYSEKIVSNKSLTGDVLCYWQMNSSSPLSKDISSRYIPKGQNLLIFNFGNEVKLTDQIIDAPIFIVPMTASSLMVNQTGNIDLFGVSFIGDGLYKLLNQPIARLDQVIPPKLHNACQKLYQAIEKSSFQSRSEGIEAFLLKHLNANLKNDRFDQAIKLINEQKGKLKISHISKHLNVSERHLQRLFKIRIGLTPKEFCKVIRVNNYINFILESKSPPDWMSLVVEFDYHDQPHLINEVKAISNLSPQKLLKYKDTLFHLYHKS